MIKKRILGASHIGYSHHDNNENKQDAFIHFEYKGVYFGYVLDGSSSAIYSEISLLIAFFLKTRTIDLIDRSIPIREIPKVIWADLIEYYFLLVSGLGLNRFNEKHRDMIANFVRKYLLHTLWGIVSDDVDTVIFHRGDGLYSINDDIFEIDRNNRPDYPAFFVIPWNAPKHARLDKPGFDEIVVKTQEIDVAWIASDGLKLSILDQLHSEIFEDDDHLQMKLNAMVFADGSTFYDDATGVALIIERTDE